MRNFVIVITTGWLAGCSGGGTGTSAASLLSAATTQAQSTHAAAKACFDAFQTCIDAASTADDVTACQTALGTCLPAQTGITAPDLCAAPPSRGDCNGDGGMRADGDRPDGGVDGDGPRGGGGPGGGPHHGPGGLPISDTGRLALATCHAELNKCVTGGGDSATCLATEHQCVHDAISADFTAFCSTLATQCAACSTGQVCTDLAARCAAGLPFGDAADGGPPPTPGT